MTDHLLAAEPPSDAPVIGGSSLDWARLPSALTGLVLVAIAAFSLIGTEPQPAPVTMAGAGAGDDVGVMGGTTLAGVPTLGD
jgi:hypothetical protein